MNKKSFIWAIVLAASIKIILCAAIPVSIWAYAGHDDRLMINMAESLISGHWLGDYSQMTLVKGITYPLFIAINYILGVPLLLVQTVLYIAACVVFTYTVSAVVHSKKYLYIIYIILLFEPVSFALGTYQRVYRDNIYYSLILILVSCMLQIYFSRDKGRRVQTKWSVLAGIILALVWHTREDGIWVMPFVFVGIILIIFSSKEHRKNASCVAVLPIIILLISNLLIGSMNYMYYGQFEINELKSSQYQKTYSLLTSIEPENPMDKIPLNSQTRQKIYAIIPSFKELEGYLEGDSGKGWIEASQIAGTTKLDEIAEGHFMWALRDAVASQGYYESPQKAEEYYKRLYDELSNAIQMGELEKNSEVVTPLVKLLAKEEIPILVQNIFETIKYILNYDNIGFDSNFKSIGSVEDLLRIENLIHQKSVYDEAYKRVSGWAVSNSHNLKLYVENKITKERRELIWRKSPDVSTYFKSQNAMYNNMEIARFSDIFDISEPSDYYLQITSNANLIDEIYLDGTTLSKSTDEYQLCFDNVKSDTYVERKIDNIRLTFLDFIIMCYNKVVPIIYLAGGVGYLYLLALRVKAYGEHIKFVPHSELLLICSALMLTAFVRIFVIAYTATTAFNAIAYGYLSPCYSLLLAFSMISIYGTYFNLRKGKEINLSNEEDMDKLSINEK